MSIRRASVDSTQRSKQQGVSVGGSASTGAEYIVGAADATLTAERVVTNTSTVTWDLATAGQAKANVATGLLPPTGSVMMWTTGTAPTGWVLCDGAAINRTTFAALFAVIGTTFGAGDGSTTFNVPDMRGRVPVGLGTHADVNALGDNDGEATVANRRPKHDHGPGNLGGTTGGPSSTTTTTVLLGAVADGVHTHNFTVTTGLTGVDGPDFLTLNFIIKV